MAAEGDRAVMAVDVGTASVRAGLFDRRGHLLARAVRPIGMHRRSPDEAEQSSEKIWRAVAASVRAARAEAGLEARDIAGIAFDATCSIVFRDRDGAPLPLSDDGAGWDTIMWLDHRASGEAAEAAASGHPVLAPAGGALWPEMAVPKLMWLKRRRPQHWARLGYAGDLTDFLTWRATGGPHRSASTLTCKWAYLNHRPTGWCPDFFAAVGLGDIHERTSLPAAASPVGAPAGGLAAEAAGDLGLEPGTMVGVGLIDGPAGALGGLGDLLGDPAALRRTAALVGGTSSCVMALSDGMRPAAGLWGPYFGAVAPGLWMTEGGQSATGALLDHLVRLHAEGRALGAAAHGAVLDRIAALRVAEGPAFAAELDLLPDFHGNRAPFGDPGARGVIAGLGLDDSFDGLCRLYFAACRAIACGVRQILDALNHGGFAIETLRLTGGHTRNGLLAELYAGVTGCRVGLPAEEDGVLLGTAVAAAAACGLYPDVRAAAASMVRPGAVVAPVGDFERCYRRFLVLHRHAAELRAL